MRKNKNASQRLRQHEQHRDPSARACALAQDDRNEMMWVTKTGRPAGRPSPTPDSRFYVPSDQLARYSSCSGVRRSILMPMDSSFMRATRLSKSSGTA